MKIRNQHELDLNLQEMLNLRVVLSAAVSNMPRHEALELKQQIDEIDGYLTLQAPTTTAH